MTDESVYRFQILCGQWDEAKQAYANFEPVFEWPKFRKTYAKLKTMKTETKAKFILIENRTRFIEAFEPEPAPIKVRAVRKQRILKEKT
jgi:hypothetical protein